MQTIHIVLNLSLSRHQFPTTDYSWTIRYILYMWLSLLFSAWFYCYNQNRERGTRETRWNEWLANSVFLCVCGSEGGLWMHLQRSTLKPEQPLLLSLFPYIFIDFYAINRSLDRHYIGNLCYDAPIPLHLNPIIKKERENTIKNKILFDLTRRQKHSCVSVMRALHPRSTYSLPPP